MKVEVEAREIALKNSHGDIAIIPVKDVAWVKEKLEQGCHSCLDEYIDTLPMGKDYAEDGTVDPGDGFWKGLLQGVKKSVNPKNWGKPDMSAEKDFGSAYQKARSQGELEFIYKGNRYNTKYAGTPEQQLRETGITDEQMHRRSKTEKKLSENLNPVGYGDALSRYVNATGIGASKSAQRVRLEQEAAKGNKPAQARLDAYALYTGKPQAHDTFSVSKFKPTKSTEDVQYLALNRPELKRDVLTWAGVNVPEKEYQPVKYRDKTLKSPEDVGDGSKQYVDPYGVMGQFSIHRGSDERGSYVSYYDKWDLKDDFGKPYEIYDRVYYEKGERNYAKIDEISKEMDSILKNKNLSEIQKNKLKELDAKRNFLWGSRNVPVTYTSNDLKKLNPDSPSGIDVRGLQEDLYNKGYDLPKSTKKDGTFDGVWGEETEAALRDWQSKNK